MMPKTGIYWGRILHNRFRPKAHRFTYPVFIFSMDLDEVASWNSRLLLFAHNGFSLYSLRDSDHGSAPGESLKAKVLNLLRERGFDGGVDKVFMVTQFRVLGYLFNPVTFYYCYRDGAPVAYVAEVNNTFHQRHSYTFFEGAAGGKADFRTDKVFYVSPFVDMGMEYRFRFETLGDKLAVFIDDYENGQAVLKTQITGAWTPFGEWPLLKSFLKIPMMSAWIIAWIHWQALKLWIKKIPVVFRPHDGMKPGWSRPAGVSATGSAPAAPPNPRHQAPIPAALGGKAA
jgi:DUF1365 family protein